MLLRTLALVGLFAAAALAGAMEEGDLREKDIADPKDPVASISLKVIIHYAIEVPKAIAPAGTTSPDQQVGLFVCFHGRGGNARGEADAFLGMLKREKLEGQYIVLGAKSLADGWEAVDMPPVAQLITWAKKTYPVNPRRVYCFGMSSGGGFCGDYTLAHPETIAAGIMYGSGLWKVPAAKDPVHTMPEIYMNMGLDDDEAHKASARGGYQKFKDLGYHVIYHEIEGLPHSEHHPPTNSDAIQWAVRLRHKTMMPSPEEVALLRPVNKDARTIAADAKPFADVALVGGFAAGEVMTRLLDTKDPTARTLAASTCSLSQFGEGTFTLLAHKLKDPTPEVRSAAIAALGPFARWRTPIAQETLIVVATAKRWDLAERQAAVAGLADAVKFQVRGVYQDPPMFRALVTLLDDEDATIRTTAWTALKSIQESTYSPDDPKPKRQSALAKWEEWLAVITKKESPEQGTTAKKR